MERIIERALRDYGIMADVTGPGMDSDPTAMQCLTIRIHGGKSFRIAMMPNLYGDVASEIFHNVIRQLESEYPQLKLITEVARLRKECETLTKRVEAAVKLPEDVLKQVKAIREQNNATVDRMIELEKRFEKKKKLEKHIRRTLSELRRQRRGRRNARGATAKRVA